MVAILFLLLEKTCVQVFPNRQYHRLGLLEQGREGKIVAKSSAMEYVGWGVLGLFLQESRFSGEY